MGIIITSRRARGGITMSAFFRSEIGRGITVAIISAGITGLALMPLFLMEFLHSL
jgi:hypothetical protein